MGLEQIKFKYLVSRISGTLWRPSLNFLRDYHMRSANTTTIRKSYFAGFDNPLGITMTYRFILRIFAFNWTLQVGRFTVARINIAGFAFSTCHLLPARSSRFARFGMLGPGAAQNDEKISEYCDWVPGTEMRIKSKVLREVTQIHL